MIQTGIIELRRSPSVRLTRFPNNDRVPTKEQKDITDITLRPHNLDHAEGLGLTLGHNKPPQQTSYPESPDHTVFPHGASRTNAGDHLSTDLGLRFGLVACQLGVGGFRMQTKIVHFRSYSTAVLSYCKVLMPSAAG